MGIRRDRGTVSTPTRLVVSGIDGGLLDPLTHGHDAARPALAALARLGMPLVLCSGRTRTEVAFVSRILGLSAPMIVENGGALLVPARFLEHGVPGAEWDGEHYVLRLGPPLETLRQMLQEVAAAAGVRVHLLDGLTPQERERCGWLGRQLGPQAPLREHTAPFLLEDEGAARAFARMAQARDLRVARGQGVWHLCGGASKGLALRTLLALLERDGRPLDAIALGAWELDLSMLRAAQRPIVLPGPDGRLDPRLAEALPRAERAPAGGPEGWNKAVLAVLAGRRLPPVGDERQPEAAPSPQDVAVGVGAEG
jgi:mannosyl-3-phosphoglycerate phosphatase